MSFLIVVAFRRYSIKFKWTKTFNNNSCKHSNYWRKTL